MRIWKPLFKSGILQRHLGLFTLSLVLGALVSLGQRAVAEDNTVPFANTLPLSPYNYKTNDLYPRWSESSPGSSVAPSPKSEAKAVDFRAVESIAVPTPPTSPVVPQMPAAQQTTKPPSVSTQSSSKAVKIPTPVDPNMPSVATPPASTASKAEGKGLVVKEPVKPIASAVPPSTKPSAPKVAPKTVSPPAAKPPDVKTPAAAKTAPAKAMPTAAVPSAKPVPKAASSPTPSAAVKPTAMPKTTPSPQEPPPLVGNTTYTEFQFLREFRGDLSQLKLPSQPPERFSTALEAISALETSPHILLHMEVIRRAGASLPEDQKKAFVHEVYQRYRLKNNIPLLMFDQGYTQLVLEQNKTGLFYLRKANDYLANPYASLAYAMAEAQADLTFEGAKPEEMTTRKMDVTFKLSDAVSRHAMAPESGFWPNFLAVKGFLSPIPVYSEYFKTDFSRIYVPFGSTPPLAMLDVQTIQALRNPKGDAPTLSTPVDWNLFYASRKVSLKDGGGTHLFFLFNRPMTASSTAKSYQLLVTDQNYNPVTEMVTPVAPYILEDLEQDGLYEIVIRQYELNDKDPVQVYRWIDGGYKLDTRITQFFK